MRSDEHASKGSNEETRKGSKKLRGTLEIWGGVEGRQEGASRREQAACAPVGVAAGGLLAVVSHEDVHPARCNLARHHAQHHGKLHRGKVHLKLGRGQNPTQERTRVNTINRILVLMCNGNQDENLSCLGLRAPGPWVHAPASEGQWQALDTKSSWRLFQEKKSRAAEQELQLRSNSTSLTSIWGSVIV